MPTTKASVMKRARKAHSHLWLTPLYHNIIDQILWDRDRVGGAVWAVVPSSPLVSSAFGTTGALECGAAGVPSCGPESSTGMLRAATSSSLAS